MDIIFFTTFTLLNMKNYLIYCFFIVSSIACKRNYDVITPKENPFEVFPSFMTKHILLENIVSETMYATVENSKIIENLKNKYKNQLIVCNMHKQDWLDTGFTEFFITKMGGLPDYPRAAVNRTVATKFLNADNHYSLISPLHWQLAIDNTLQEETHLTLAAQTFVSNNKMGKLILHIAFDSSIYNNLKVGIYLVQNNIKSVFQVGASPQFLHQYVLKESITNIDGDSIVLQPNVNGVNIMSVTYDQIDLSLYDIQNAQIIAFIFEDNKEFRKIKVLNSIELKWGGFKYWNQ